MKNHSNFSKYTSLLTLYLAQAIPMTFFATVLPVIMRIEHFSLTSIGLLQLIKLPWILKFLWAPIIDKSNGEIAKYKQWIFSSELFYAIIIFAVAFLNFHTDFKLIIILLVIAFTASATQDIATDAFSYIVLTKDERSFGSSIQTTGSFLGTLIGSGVLLVIYHYYGWRYLILSLGVFVLLALLPLVFYKPEQVKINPRKKSVRFSDITTFFKHKGNIRQAFLLLIFYAGIIGILTMVKPWLVDLGYSIKDIGIYSGIYGPVGGVIFALLSGYLIKKIGMTKMYIIYFVMSSLVAWFFWYLTIHTPVYYQIQLAIIGIWSVYSMGTVFVYTLIMNNIRQGSEGTDYTLQIVIAHIGSLIMAVLSGNIAHKVGYNKLFLIEAVISMIVLFIFTFNYKKIKQNEI